MNRRIRDIMGNRGAALLEFVLCFPILFVLFLFIMQLSQILLTWQVVHYAAYMGARSTMTVNNLQRKSRAENVVKRILAVVSQSPSDSTVSSDRAKDDYILLDGWGRLPNTRYLDKQVTVSVPLTDIDPRGVRCTVKFRMFLQVPVAGRIISFFAKTDETSAESQWETELEKQYVALNPAFLGKYANEWNVEGGQGTGYPYIELTSHGIVSIPYGTKYYPIAP